MSITCFDSDGNVLKALYQWDNNQTLTVQGLDMPPIPVFHFCNRLSNLALVVNPTVSGTSVTVNIPNILLQQAEPIIAYVYQDTENDGYRTMHAIHIPVIPRPKPDDYEYEDNIDYISVAVLNSRLNTLLKSLSDGAESDIAPEVIDIRVGYDGTVYDTAGNAVRALGDDIQAMKEELEHYVDTKAVDGLYYEDNLLYLTSNGEIVSDPVEIVGGGGGGGGGGATSVVKLINENDSTSFGVAAGGDAIIKFTFTSTEDDVPTGNGTCRVQVGGVTKANINITQGHNEINVKNYLSAGTNTVKITCTDIYGMFRSIVYTISVVELEITSTFDDTSFYTGNVTFKYTPYGMIEKTIHIYMDGKEAYTTTTTASGRQSTKIFPKMSHGVHKLDAYITAVMDGSEMESNHLVYEIMCVEEGNTTPFIASPFARTEASQGEQLSIPYTVYDPAKLTCDIELSVYTMNAGTKIVYSTQEISVDRTRKYWNTRRYPTGTVYFEISYPDGSVSKVISMTISEASIDVQPVSNDLELALLSAGRSNSEANPAIWEYDDVSTTFENVNWSSTGWIEDENGDTALRLNGDATATVDYKPFSKDLRIHGKTIEIEFAIRDVNNRDAVVIDCMTGGIGFRATADTAVLMSEQSSVECRYKDEEKVRVTCVIESRNEYRMMSIYLNGVLSGAKQYPANDNFQQSAPVSIKLGSKYCAIDIYTIRAYDTALSTTDVTNNYIADIADVAERVEVYNNNDIYDDYGKLSYEMLKPKIPVMTIVGALPQSKGDKKTVTIIYEDPFNPDLNFTDTCTIDVQGTSSQWYVRKNWKLKFATAHQHAIGQMPAKTFCMKVDYAEGTGTHNTQNANLVDTLYTEQVPAQTVDERVRTAVYGFPCVIFSQADETSDPVFYGKANFNFDKGAENVFGFTSEHDVECWEFKNNTSDVCNFNGTMPTDWSEDFEARYPEDNTNISRLASLIAWVYSTKNNLTKFKNEFAEHFNVNYTLTYYVYTFVLLMVDQRAKNMMFTYWDETGKWYPYFYDNDTCLGINNEGQLVFDYYHEDTDQLNGANVFNGQSSVLWNNVRLAFADEIKAIYQSLRNSGKLTYDVLCDRFITQGSDVWSESIYNEDSDFKYVSMLRSDNDSSNLYQIRGDGEQHFKYFVKNRLDYCDGKWYASDYANDYISLRIYTPKDEDDNVRTDLVVAPNANITVIPFSNMYAGVRYKANGTLQQARATKNEAVTFTAPDEVFTDTETAIYGASNLSSLGDLAPLYCGTINVSKATKLVTLKIGDETAGYSNPNLTDLSVGTNRLLKTLDVRNCPNLTDPLALSNCPNIENIYAEGSGITGVELPDSGYLKVVHLPATLRNLTLRNQIYITDFSLAGKSELKTIWIENCPIIDTQSFISGCTALERIRFVGVDWECSDATFLKSLMQYGGLDETGANTDTAFISGTCHIDTLTGEEMAELVLAYPYLTITYDNLTSKVFFMSEDGKTQYATATAYNGGDVVYPGATPTKAATAQYTYTYDGWSTTIGGNVNPNALKNVAADRYVYAHFAATLQKYTVTFVNASSGTAVTMQTVTNVPYGSSAQYTEATPTYGGGSSDYVFVGWNPDGTNITGNTTCYAVFRDTALPLFKYLNRKMVDYEGTTGSKVASYAFYKFTTLATAKTSANIIEENAFSDCTSLTTVDLTGTDAAQIGANAFSGCTKLESVIIRSNTLGTLSATSAFTGTKIASGNGAIYVPGALVDTYKAASNWSAYLIYPIDAYPVTDYSTISDSWDEIFAAETNGTYATKYKVGDTKKIDVNNTQVYMQIAAIDGDALADGSGNAKISWVCKSILNTQKMNSSNVTTDGWAATAMRTYLRDTLLPTLPDNVKAAIKEVNKTYKDYTTSSTLTIADTIWIPSGREVFGGTSYENDGVIYSGLFDSAANRIKCNASGAAAAWWLRSATSGTYFYYVNSSGTSSSYGIASTSYGVVFGFCT